MTLTRRNFLKLGGVVTLVVASGGAWRAMDQGVFSTGQGVAYEPWETWDANHNEGTLALVRAAILAANPHNTQPWLFRVTESRIDLFADTQRNIGTIDPFLREMYTGLGCALENLWLAAQANGYAATLALLPDAANPAHVARVDLGRGEKRATDLYRAIPHRHTNRGAYDPARKIPAATLAALQALGQDLPDVNLFWFTTDAQRQQIGEKIIQAAEALVADQQQAFDSNQWFRTSWHQVQELRDGVTLDAQGLPDSIRVMAKMLPPLSQEQNDVSWLQSTREVHVATAAAFGILAVRNNHDNAQRMQGGRLWQRMHLWATNQGIAMQPLNQMPERADREASLGSEPRFGNALQELIGNSAWQALMPFRLGYPQVPALPSPRRDASQVLLKD